MKVAPKIWWRVVDRDYGAKVAVTAILEDGRIYGVSMPRESFNRHGAKAAIQKRIGDAA